MSTKEIIRPDNKEILNIIEVKSTVLDLGCGSGDLMELLERKKDCKTTGIEIDDKAVYECVAKGLSVHHGDIDTGLSEYRDKAFDYVILNQSLQQVKHIDPVIQDALRVGKHVIVGVPNFAFIRARIQLGLLGHSPMTPSLPYKWHETPNLRFLSINDFFDYCKEKKIKIEKTSFVGEKSKVYILPNIFAGVGIFLLSK